MSTNKQRGAQIAKPNLHGAAIAFASGAQKPQEALPKEKAPDALPSRKETAPRAGKSLSGLIPEGDVRLTANIREDLHMRLKMESVKKRITIGEIIESWIEEKLP